MKNVPEVQKQAVCSAARYCIMYGLARKVNRERASVDVA